MVTQSDWEDADAELDESSPLASPALRTRRPAGRFAQVAAQEPETMPAEETPVAPTPETPPAPPHGASPQKITLPLGETHQLRVPTEIGKYRRYVVSRDKVLSVIRSPAPEGAEAGVTFLTLVGYKYAKVQLTLIGDTDQTATFDVEVIPSLSHVEAVLLKQFPNSSLKLTQVADNILMVEGTVDSAEEVDPILLLLRNFVQPPRGQVINGLRVAGVMQVQLDVVVASVNRDKARELGFNFQQGDSPWYLGNQVGSIMASPLIRTPAGAMLPAAGGASAAPLSESASMFFGVATDNNQFYGYLQALQQNQCFKVLANPSLVTLSGRPARFLVGGRQPYPVPAGVGQTPGVQWERFGTELVFTPLVLGQGRIRLDLRPQVSRLDPTNSVNLAGTTVPSFVTQEVRATVELQSGQTVVLGGLLESQMTAQISKVPFLGDLPIAGALFRTVAHKEEEKELLILATPHLVGPLEPEQYPSDLPGDETRSPTNKELYWHGQGEVEVGECDPVLGARPQVGLPTPDRNAPFPVWEPKPIPAQTTPDPKPEAESRRRGPVTAPSAYSVPASPTPFAAAPPAGPAYDAVPASYTASPPRQRAAATSAPYQRPVASPSASPSPVRLPGVR